MSKLYLSELIETGLPVANAVFHQSVRNGDGTPENNFNASSSAPSRRVTMYLTSLGLVCVHKGKYILTPLANLVDVVFESSEMPE